MIVDSRSSHKSEFLNQIWQNVRKTAQGESKSQFDLQFTCFIWMQLCTLRISGAVRRIMHRHARGSPVSPQLRIITLSNSNSYVASHSLQPIRTQQADVFFCGLDKLGGFRTGSRVLFFHLLFSHQYLFSINRRLSKGPYLLRIMAKNNGAVDSKMD